MRLPSLVAGLVLLAAFGRWCPAADDVYAKKATWFDSVIACREALAAPAGQTAEPVPLPDFGGGKYTFTAWVRTKRDGSIFAKTRARGAWVRDGKALFLRGGRVCFDIGWTGAVNGRTRVADGKWHHVAFSGGVPQRIYVDGKLDAEGRLEKRPDVAGSVLKIGWTSTNFPRGNAGLVGEIDDVRLYDRVLTDAEIRAAASGDAPDKGRGPRAHWPLDGDATDASGGRNHGATAGKCRFVPGRLGKALAVAGDAHVVVSCGRGAGPMAAIWPRLAADFADPDSRQEMQWERADGIWGADLVRATYADLARRYAAAARQPSSLARRVDALAAGAKSADDLRKVRALYLTSRRYALALERIAAYDLKGLRATIEDLYPTRRRRDALLVRLDALEAGAATWAAGEIPPRDLDRWQKNLVALRREVLVTNNPLIDFDKLLFVRRNTYNSNHYYTEFINSQWLPGGNLCVLDLKTGTVTELVSSLKGGVFGRFDLSFDAKRIVFAWKCAHQEGYRIYEMNVDGTGLRQLTFPQKNEKWLVESYRARAHYHHGTDDMHPCYLPDGGIAFISTRCQYGILCDGPDDFTTTVLYRMDADGGNMQRLSNSSVSEASPVMLPDGRILYTRWEYVDKGAVSVKCLWVMYPDGTVSSEVYANDISLPPTFIYSRPIPAVVNEYVVVGTPHYPQNGVGTIIRLDMSRNIRTRDPMTYLTPYVDIRGEGGFAFREGDGPWRGDRRGNGPLFRDPYPLSRKYFLVSHKPKGRPWTDPKGYAIYLLDETGKVSQIHRDPEISCWQPYPLRPRERPPVLASARNAGLAKQGLARCVVADVYHGLEGVERGEIKYIRIFEQAPRPWAARRRWSGDEYDQQHVCISKDTHLGLKVQYGIVPVEEDGSANFVVPALRNIAFQALDENHLAVQTERTYVNYMPGETRSCVGCHETPHELAPIAGRDSIQALRRPPSRPGPQPGETSGGRPLHYITDVQPVLDKHCVRCHGAKDPKGKLDLRGDLTELWCISYESLVPERRRRPRGDRGLLGPIIGENHPKTGNVHYLPARSLGSHASVLVAMLAPGKVKLADARAAQRAAALAEKHKHLRLAPEELLRITNWVDTNAQYYGSWWGRRRLRYKDHPNFRPVPTLEAAASTTSPIPEDQR